MQDSCRCPGSRHASVTARRFGALLHKPTLPSRNTTSEPRRGGLKHLVLALAAASALLATGSAARGEDAFEIQVYDSEIDKPLEPSLEFHLNYVARGRRDEDYHREVTPDQLVHMTLEPALGVTDFLELGGYLQFAWDPRGVGGGTAYFGG